MRHRRSLIFAFFGVFISIIGVALWLLLPQPVDAQCGSQASSCKTCHEVEAKHPVNNDGTNWHKSHGFGDFCTLCHAGNQQATDKIAAHTSLVPPLSDVKASCQSCHPSDLAARAQVYAVILKVTPGFGDTNATIAAPTSAPTSAGALPVAQPTAIAPTSVPVSGGGLPAVQPAVSLPTPADLVVDDPNTIDYVQRYNEIVLGQRPVNYGNITLLVLIGLVLIGGGSFVTFNEIRKSKAFSTTKPVEGGYPAEVVEMLPAITRLTIRSRQALRNILNHPQKTEKVLGVIDSLVSNDKPEEEHNEGDS